MLLPGYSAPSSKGYLLNLGLSSNVASGPAILPTEKSGPFVFGLTHKPIFEDPELRRIEGLAQAESEGLEGWHPATLGALHQNRTWNTKLSRAMG